MDVCSNCRSRVAPEQDLNQRLPMWTVAGGVLGALAAAATGALVVVPAAMVMGSLADACRCGVCGGNIKDGEARGRVLRKQQDQSGRAVYRSIADAPRPGSIFQDTAPARLTRDMQLRLDLPDMPDWRAATSIQQEPPEPSLVFDELQGMLVPSDSPLGGEDSQVASHAADASPHGVDGPDSGLAESSDASDDGASGDSDASGSADSGLDGSSDD